MATVFRRAEILILISGILTGLILFDYFFPVPGLSDAVGVVNTWAAGVSAFALALGFLSAARIHLYYIQRRIPGRWPFSLWLFILTAVLTVSGLISEESLPYAWSFKWVLTPLGATLYAITGFYIFSAAYRAFRARSLEAGILLVAGIIVMLGNTTSGELIWNQIPIINEWLQLTGQTPAMRALLFTASLGLVIFGFRVLIGAERGYLGVSGEGGS